MKGQENATIDDEGTELLLCSGLGMHLPPSPRSSYGILDAAKKRKKHKLQEVHGGEENRIGVSRGSVAISGHHVCSTSIDDGALGSDGSFGTGCGILRVYGSHVSRDGS